MVVSDNRLYKLPSDLFTHFKALIYLFLANNRLTHLPSSIGALRSLQILSVENNRILGLTPSMGDLQSLHTFYVHRNPRLKHFPLEFGKLRHVSSGGSLKELLYDADSVRYPPPEVSSSGLPLALDFLNRMWDAGASGSLNLNGVGLRAVPARLCEEPLRSCVTELSMLQNDITRLPPELGYLTNLDVLRLDEAAIAFPPEPVMRQSDPLRDDALHALRGAARAPFMHFLRRVADCARTRELELRGGAWGPAAGGLELRLGVVARELTGRTGCKLLDLRDNDVRELPPSIRRMTALTALLLDRNRLRYVPAELGDVTTLRVLSASHNDVAELPDALARLAALTDLDLSHNRLGRLPPSLAACTGLTRLAVGDNALEALPAGLDRLARLRYVHVGGNPLARLPPELGASPFLTEATADRCPRLATCGPDVALAAVPPRSPAPHLDPGPSRLLCNAQRLVALVAQPALAAELAALDVRRVLAAPPPPSSLLRAVVQSHCEMTAGSRAEELCRAERRQVVFDEGPLLYGRTWRLGKAAQLRGADAGAVNQAAAAAMPQTARAPALVRLLWGLWGGHRLAVADVSGTGLRRVPAGVLEASWLTKLCLAYNRLAGLPDALAGLTQLTSLDVGHNLLASLPPAVGALTALRELGAAFNMLAALPKEMAGLEQWVYPRDARARHVYDTAWIAGNPIAFPHMQARAAPTPPPSHPCPPCPARSLGSCARRTLARHAAAPAAAGPWRGPGEGACVWRGEGGLTWGCGVGGGGRGRRGGAGAGGAAGLLRGGEVPLWNMHIPAAPVE